MAVSGASEAGRGIGPTSPTMDARTNAKRQRSEVIIICTYIILLAGRVGAGFRVRKERRFRG